MTLSEIKITKRDDWSSELKEYLTRAANLYKKTLANKDFLLLCNTEGRNNVLEVGFASHSFGHLLGINYKKETKKFFVDSQIQQRKTNIVKPDNFFLDACKGLFNSESIDFPLEDKFFSKKTVFEEMCNFAYNSILVADYKPNKGSYFYSDKIVVIHTPLSSNLSSPGFVARNNPDSNGILISNTLLNLTSETLSWYLKDNTAQSIIGIFSKPHYKKRYQNIEKLTSGIDIYNSRTLYKIIHEYIDCNNITSHTYGLLTRCGLTERERKVFGHCPEDDASIFNSICCSPSIIKQLSASIAEIDKDFISDSDSR